VLVFGYCVYALFDSIQIQGRSPHYEILYGIATFYLALHYTGQAWGTTVTFAWLDGIRFSNAERIILRSGFRLLAVWHMIWVAHQDRFVAEDLLWLSFPLHGIITIAAITAFVAGLVVFCRIWWRTKTAPSVRCIVSWASIYLWYVLIQIAPGAFFWLQISHALQYMIFPARVALNRYAKDQVTRPLKPLLTSYILLTGLGYITFAGALLISDDPVTITIAGLVAVFVNIHHYFTDGCIWKISNRAVRDDLFSHLRK
jgi:hypothetical protein